MAMDNVKKVSHCINIASSRTFKRYEKERLLEEADSEHESAEGDEEEIDDDLDPFVRHFNYDLEENLLEAVSTLPKTVDKHQQHWPILGQFTVHIPKAKTKTLVSIPKVTIEEKRKFAKTGTVPQRITSVCFTQLHVKSQIQNNITKANFTNLHEIHTENMDPLTPLQKELFSIINNYQDLYYPERTLKNGEEIRFTYCLHSINHILKTRTKILHHNNKLLNKYEVPEEYRDQGLVRPKVIILVPFREAALRVVKMMMEIILPDEKANVMNKRRFFDEFTGNEIAMPKKKPRPEDYEETFVGNTDDTFRIGITVTKKSIRLYADFYSADIIVASPLGLRVIVGAEGEEGRDFDFLASVELLVLDQADIFLMQNWDHLLHILDHFHLQPREAHGINFSRVRSWALNGWSRYYRQTLLFSSVILPELNALMSKKCHNYAGKICVANPELTGTICHVVVQLPQVFHRFDVPSVVQIADDRFEFFIKKILPQYKNTVMSHVLIYIPSYFDYVRLRNYFRREGLNFVQICEYSKEGKIARARDMFFHAEAHFLLYSERFHFFRRPSIKGILHILFYQPPTFPHFYSEMCNLIRDTNQNQNTGDESNMTVTVLYSKYDVHRLAAIVGTDRAARMVSSERNVHMFMTGE
ncbi:Digestive organ expansion factor-like protein [Cryptotermes secundus]|uniref:U3 small nucleolar RNA-associated protein 25 homolog n=2 Tax=Cryptotermes secundus TaxID=105785 RepID=A0A2J7RA10_9NEOP|nr:digestive organ expansion factor homolog [Cryptotermes secundus]PNF37678.1 Digestive organ expansion factor-like protein [Cryptotermes secundus]